MGNRVPRLATPCFVAGDGGRGPHADDTAPDASIGHILSFNGTEGPAFAGAIHGVLLPSNQSTPACPAASTANGQLSLLGSSSFDSSNSFSFRALQPRQYSGPLDYCTSPSTSSARPSTVWMTRQLRHTDEQILADVYAAQHQRQSQVSKNSILDTVREAVASMLCVAPCGSLTNKQPDEPVVVVVNGAGEAARNKYSVENGKNGEVTVDGAARVQWARGKAGEDRVHVVVSEERGWMFVGIYDGFNGPDAADYLLANLYTSMCCKLNGILSEDEPDGHEPEDAAPRGGACRRTARRRMVLDALARALRETEEGYFAAAEERAAECPELAMTGSCVLVVLMKGADVYVMNIGDSRAVLAHRAEPDLSGIIMPPHGDDLAGIKEEIRRQYDACEMGELAALQLTMDHRTSVYKEVRRIRSEHRDDPGCILNGRVKGSLKVTRAFGAGYLKEPRCNRALLEVFQVDYIGTSPYIICRPYLRHHRLGSRDKFLILSSDGLYQYFTNEEVVAQVEAFTSRYPNDDPAKYLSQEILLRAANRAGIGFHELIKIAQGDRRRYHDDVSILIISLQGKIWRSAV